MRRRFKLWQGFVLSLFIHAGLVLPFLLAMPQQQKKPHTLKVELQGLISNRQVEQKKAAAPPPRPATPPPVEQKEVAKPPEKKVVKKDVPAPPIKKKPVLEPVEEEAPPAAVAQPSPLPQASQASPVQQTQQTIQRNDDDDAFKGYLKALKKKLQDNLIYPESAKLSDLHGTAVVGFSIMENGAIRDESLRIIRSSGFPELDRNALVTARSSAPFERPSKEIAVAVAVAFEVKK